MTRQQRRFFNAFVKALRKSGIKEIKPIPFDYTEETESLKRNESFWIKDDSSNLRIKWFDKKGKRHSFGLNSTRGMEYTFILDNGDMCCLSYPQSLLNEMKKAGLQLNVEIK